MTQLRIFICTISILFTVLVHSQEVRDTVKVKYKYGLRVGVDISKPIISFTDEANKGLELLGDYRIKRNLYVAAEIGYQEKTTQEDYLNFTTKGSYIKIGGNFNAYQNWVGMSNEIFFGFRYGLSFFSQTLNSYTPNRTGTFFIPPTVEPNTKFDSLSAHWAELIFGLKVETFNNLYLGVSCSLKKMLSTKEPENFKNLQVPGFYRVFSNDMGIGFNYSISYLIPIVKKEK